MFGQTPLSRRKLGADHDVGRSGRRSLLASRVAASHRRGRVRRVRLLMRPDDPAGSASVGFLLICPRCGLSIRPRARWLAIEYCPRCMARARIPVAFSSSARSTVGLYTNRSAPLPKLPGAPKTKAMGSK